MNLNWPSLEEERKKQLLRIGRLRGGRDVLAFASAMTGPPGISIVYEDREAMFDLLSDLKGEEIDVLLETPGGSAEVVQDMVVELRRRFTKVGMIVPGWAKSAGTIMVMAGDEILMGPNSAVGPIDAQIQVGNMRFSAHEFLEGFEKIKKGVEKNKGKLNLAYVPILQNVSPGEIERCENLKEFSKGLVTTWLSQYKFKFWEKHSGSGAAVTEEEKKKRAEEIAEELGNRKKWRTHGQSIYISDLHDMGLKITDFSDNTDLYDAILRYSVLLKMSFETTNIIKILETPYSQFYRHSAPRMGVTTPKKGDIAEVEIECPHCKNRAKIQANFRKGIPLIEGAMPFPKDDVFVCPNCNKSTNINSIKRHIESDTKRKVILEG